MQWIADAISCSAGFQCPPLYCHPQMDRINTRYTLFNIRFGHWNVSWCMLHCVAYGFWLQYFFLHVNLGPTIKLHVDFCYNLSLYSRDGQTVDRVRLIWRWRSTSRSRTLDLSIAMFYIGLIIITACLVRRLTRLTDIQEVPSSIPGYTLEIFLEV